MKSKLEIGLIEGENILKKSGVMLINNLGKTIATITLFVSALVMFTDVSFADLGTESFVSSALIILLASYLMYFSLEDAGERLGEESDEYKAALLEYDAEKKKIGGDEIEALRSFCLRYSEEDLKYRQRALVTSYALSPIEFEKYLSGEKTNKEWEKVFKKAARLRAVPISPRALLTKDRESKKSELINPEKFKLLSLVLKLIPTTVCMTVTVSVMLTAKEGLDAAGVIEGILKLSALPVIGFRGYASGYGYVRKCYIPWIETKRRLLETYNEKKHATT